MKKLIAGILIAVGFIGTANAYDVQPEMPIQELQSVYEKPVMMSSEELEIAKTRNMSHYCCKPKGFYCDMGYYDRFGQPCKCKTGERVTYGHVCRS